MAMPAIDLTGKRFGRLAVISRHSSSRYGVKWLCRCDCGKEVAVISTSLRRRNSTESCGCLKRETIPITIKHGLASTRAYHSWVAAKYRCEKPSNVAYGKYGGAGITMCKEWSDSVEAFIGDMGFPPTDKHTIDRINNSLGYSPENCRWATMQEQQRNRTNNVVVYAFGERKIACEWAEDRRCAVSIVTLRSRLKNGWAPERAITEPNHRPK